MRFFHPGIKGLPQSLSFILNGKIDERGRAAEGCSDGAGLEIVGAGGAAEGHIQMCVHIDTARNDEKSCGIDDAASIVDGELSSKRRDFVAADAEVRGEGVHRGNDRAVADDGVKTHGRTSCQGRRLLVTMHEYQAGNWLTIMDP